MLDREATIGLNMIPGIGHVKYTALCEAFGSPAGAAGQQKSPGHRGLLGIFHRSCAQPAAAHIPPFCLERATACPQEFCHSRPVCVAMGLYFL